MTYARSVLMALDRLGNALSGGNSLCTISGRTGYYARFSLLSVRWFWILLEKVIDFAFFPFDGKGHCYQAYLKETKNEFYRLNSFRFLALFVLAVLTIPTCVLISSISWPIYFVKLLIKNF